MTVLAGFSTLSPYFDGGELDETDDPDAPPITVEVPSYECGCCGRIYTEAFPVDDDTLACRGCRLELAAADFL